MIYNELKQHGTDDFPFELYQLSEEHPKYKMALHWHGNLELVRVLEGQLELTLDTRTYTLTAGNVAFINSETIHGAIPKNCVYECIVFNLAFLKTNNGECDSFIDNLLSHGHFLTEFPSDKEVLALTHRVFELLRKKENGATFKFLGAFHELLGEIQQKGLYTSYLSPDSLHNEQRVVKLKTVLKFMRENFANDITLEDMSAIAGFSCKYFCKFFKEMTGTTPINYLMAYRIERAARRLLSTDKSITRIAFECGFNDLSYFIKTFKAYKNDSPKEYRRKATYREKNEETT